MSTKTFRYRLPLTLLPCFLLATGLTGQDLNRDLPTGDRFKTTNSASMDNRQTSHISGPVMGLVFDKNSGLRPILGIPGAAIQGNPINSIGGLSAAVAPAGNNYALAIASSNRQPFFMRDVSDPLSAISLPGVPTGADAIITSPGGSAAALRYGETAQIIILTGIPDAPTLSWKTDTGTLPGPILSLAISDDGSSVLATAGDDAQQSVLLLTKEQQWRILASVNGQAGIAFLNNSNDALLAEGAANQVFLVRDIGSAARFIALAGKSEGVSAPVAVAASADNRRIIIANSDPGGIVSITLDGRDVQASTCNCSPTGLHRLNGNAVFRLNEPSATPLYVYDGDTPDPRIVFIPPPVQTAAVKGGSQ